MIDLANRIRAAAHAIATHLENGIADIESDAKELLERLEDLVGLGNTAQAALTPTEATAPVADPAPAEAVAPAAAPEEPQVAS